MKTSQKPTHNMAAKVNILPHMDRKIHFITVALSICAHCPIHGSGPTPVEDGILRDACYHVCGREALHCILQENGTNAELLGKLSDTYNQYIEKYNAQNGTKFPKQTPKILQECFAEQFSEIEPREHSHFTDECLPPPLTDWTPEEDRCLLEITAQGCSSWSQIVPLFPGKSPLQIRNRHLQLQTAPGNRRPKSLSLRIPN
jgi:hypothetical protein